MFEEVRIVKVHACTPDPFPIIQGLKVAFFHSSKDSSFAGSE